MSGTSGAEVGRPKGLSARQLEGALLAARSDADRFPYMDDGADVIDGSLSALCDWLTAHYAIVPRS